MRVSLVSQQKHFYTISEVSEICAVKPHVLRYWEKEFDTLKPSTRRGRRRYYQVQDIEHIQTIRRLLYDEGFTISGARTKMLEIQPYPKQASPDALKSCLEDTISQLANVLNYCRKQTATSAKFAPLTQHLSHLQHSLLFRHQATYSPTC